MTATPAIDTHAHLHDVRYDDDRDAVVARMRAAGISAAVTVGCDLEDSRRAQKTAQRYDLMFSAGIHPHEAKDAPADIAEAFEPFLDDPRLAAIGETGLDYFYEHSSANEQERALRAQIRLARARNFPLIFHHREAFADFTRMLEQEWNDGMRGVVHCFTGDAAQAATYIDTFGLYLGIGGVLTFKTSQTVREAVASVGIDRLVLETDCPYLAPVPHRGKRNEPAFVRDTAAALASLLSLTPETIAERTSKNARELFGFPSP